MEKEEKYIQGLSSASPLTGREIFFSNNIGQYLSEGALHKNRAKVQLLNIKMLSESGFKYIRKLTDEEKKIIDDLASSLSDEDAKIASMYDHFTFEGQGPFEHDVKSVEYVVRRKLLATSMKDLVEFVHFPFTSEDVSNIAYNLMIKDAINKIWLPKTLEVCDRLKENATNYADLPVLGLSHGQAATPTTIGKRFAYFLNNITETISSLNKIILDAKCSSTVGNHNAITATYPEFDYELYAKKFVESFGFEYQPMANQRNTHQRIVRVLKHISEVNTIMYDLSENVWLNVSRGWIDQLAEKTYVGSSIMPHKINPWFFEVAEGYAQISNSIIKGAEEGLCMSRVERDLSDHPWERMYGEMIGYSVVALDYIAQGLEKLAPNKEKCLKDLEKNPKVITEAIQIAGRMIGAENPYAKMRELTRGKEGITLELLKEVIDQTITDEKIKESLKQLTPKAYIGLAKKLSIDTVERYKKIKSELQKEILTIPTGGIHKMNSKIKAIVYDFDNTLVATNEYVLQHLIETSNRVLGAEQTQTLARTSYVKEIQSKNLPFEEIFTTIFGEETGSKVLAEYRATAKDKPFFATNGGISLVNHFKTKGVYQGILTNRTNMLPERLAQAEYPALDFLLTPSSKEHRKPSPRAFDAVLEELAQKGISKEEVLSIGDHTDDYLSAKAAGIKFVAVLTGETTKEEFVKKGLEENRIVKNLQEIIPIAENL
ncbi:MAG: HAD-IA family hydrolase [archaeon]